MRFSNLCAHVSILVEHKKKLLVKKLKADTIVLFPFRYVFHATILSLFHLKGSACVFKTDFWQLYRVRSNIIPVHFFPALIKSSARVAHSSAVYPIARVYFGLRVHH
jgi:hypothetical protein